MGLDDLAILGPIFVLKLKTSPEELQRKLVAEMWIYPDYSRILELSTKCAPAKMVQVALETRLFLTKRGVDLSGEQQTKTRTALEFFSQGARERLSGGCSARDERRDQRPSTGPSPDAERVWLADGSSLNRGPRRDRPFPWAWDD